MCRVKIKLKSYEREKRKEINEFCVLVPDGRGTAANEQAHKPQVILIFTERYTSLLSKIHTYSIN